MSVSFGSAHYYTKQGNEYKKTNFFKKVGTLAGAAALIPAGMEIGSLTEFGADSFVRLIKKGPNQAHYFYASLVKNKFLNNILHKGLDLMKTSKLSRYGFVIGGLALAAGAAIGVGRLVGSVFDGIINGCKRHRADKRAAYQA